MSDTINERDASAGSDAAAREDELARQEAIKRIEHKRRSGSAPPRPPAAC